MTDTDYAWTKLTVEQLATAHDDLMNAALVAEHAGWVQGTLVDLDSGAVCSLGAIEVSTFKKLRTMTVAGDTEWYTAGHEEAGKYRSENAAAVLAQVLPDELCESCTQCVCGDGWEHHSESWERVVHYNDEHCPGGTAAAEMLRTGARNALREADVRRKLFDELRVPVNA